MPTKPVKPANRGLTVKVIGDQLVISIGVEVLAYALQNGPEPFGAQIKNAKGFAKDVAIRLENDPGNRGEEGGTPLMSLLWDAAQSTIEWGSQHVVFDGDSESGIYPPLSSGSYPQESQ